MKIFATWKVFFIIMCHARLTTSRESRLLLRKNQKSCEIPSSPCIQDSDCCGYDKATARCEARHNHLGTRCYKSIRLGGKCENDHECRSQNCVNGQCIKTNLLRNIFQDDTIKKDDVDYSMLRLKVYIGDTIQKEDIDYSKLRLTLVISHCDEDMSWMKDKFNIPIQNVIIYSKCSSKISGYFPPNAKIVKMPNIGRCDHSYAHWMSNMEEKDAADNHLVLFFKASRNKPRFLHYWPLDRAIQIAMRHGFACETTHKRHSPYHDTDKLGEFSIDYYKRERVKSPYSNMREWMKDLGIKLPTPTPVCYTGNFVAKATQIYSQRHIFSKMERSLTRGDNIEEGHFAERAWAGLLSYPLSTVERELFGSIQDLKGISGGPFAGDLFSPELGTGMGRKVMNALLS